MAEAVNAGGVCVCRGFVSGSFCGWVNKVVQFQQDLPGLSKANYLLETKGKVVVRSVREMEESSTRYMGGMGDGAR